MALLTAVWFAGIYAHTFLLTAALPELTRRQALTLNLSGSAVSNLVPFGGALGVGLGLAMARSWGFRSSAFALFTVLTNLWNVLAKLLLPLLAVLVLWLGHDLVGGRLATAALFGGLVLAGLAAVVIGSLASEAVARRLGVLLQRAACRLLRWARSSRQVQLTAALIELRHHTRALLGRRWQQMSAGVLAYVLLQGLLLGLILHMLHAGLGLEQVLAGFALERFLTLAVVTPGGVGIAQTGSAALLVALGGAPAQTAAGVLVYSLFVFALEIPVGAASGLWWLRTRRAPGTA